tara:strand:+ start:510 stop:701 length:192 start_codon:yes stop_codon:yes gene_type:complete
MKNHTNIIFKLADAIDLRDLDALTELARINEDTANDAGLRIATRHLIASAALAIADLNSIASK